MDEEFLVNTLSTVVLPYLRPEMFGKLVLLNKRFKEVFERHAFWARAVTLYFPRAFQRHKDELDTDWLIIFRRRYKYAYQGLPSHIKNLFAAIKFDDIPVLRTHDLDLSKLMSIENQRERSLLSAIIRGNANQVTRDYVFNEIITPMHLDINAKNETADEYGYHLLHWAVVLNQPAAINEMLTWNTELDINIGTEKNEFCTFWLTPLHFAVTYHRLNIVKQLLAAGADMYADDSKGYSPLHFAAKVNDVAIMQLFIDAEADLTHRSALNDYSDNYRYDRPIDVAAKYDALDIVNLLIDANVSVEGQGFGPSPLFTAVIRRNLAMVNTLINARAEVNHQLFQVVQPLIIAIRNNDVDIVRALAQAGANLRRKFKDPFSYWVQLQTPLTLAISRKQNDIAKVLIEEQLNRYIRKLSNSNTTNTSAIGIFKRTNRQLKIKAARSLIKLTNGANPRLFRALKPTIKTTPELNSLYKNLKHL